MNWILARLRQRRINRELAEEIESHIAERVDDLMDSGMDEVEARAQARRDFGNATLYLESSREVWSSKWFEELGQDLRYGIRTLRRTPVFTAVVILSLALGIGANTAIFSLMNAVMWRTLPVRDPQQLWVLHLPQGTSSQGFLFHYSAMGNEYFFPYRLYLEMRDRNQVAELAAYSGVRLNVSVEGSLEPTADGLRVSGNYFSLLGIKPVAGRMIAAEDDVVPNSHPVAVISYDYWKNRFGLDTSTVGRTIWLSGTPFEIIGVSPPEFQGVEVGISPDIYVPLSMQPAVTPVVTSGVEGTGVDRPWLQIVARLKPDIDPQDAAASLQAFYTPDQGLPGITDRRVMLSPASAGVTGLRQQFSETLFILMAVVAIVLLIACANIASLLLARATARRPEIAMRLALGAGRWRLVRQLLVECTLLAIAGGAFGCLLAQLATRSMVAYMSAGRSALILDLHFSVRVLLFTAAVSILTGLLFGIAPALRATHIDLTPALKNRTETSGGRSSLRAGKVLAVAQIALSLLLLAGAGLFVRSLVNLNRQDEGFNRDKVLIVRVEPKLSNQRNERGVPARLDRIYTDLLQRIRAIPEVQSASLANVSPTKPESGASAGSLQARSGERVAVSAQVVYPKYFETMGIPVFDGRDFNDQDLTESSMRVCVVNETFAKLAFPGEDPMGRPCVGRDSTRFGVIVGLVKDSRYTSLNGPTPPVIYQPFLQANTLRGQMILHVRMNDEGKPDFIATRIREEVWKTDKEVPQFEVRSLAQEVNAVLVQQRMIATLSTLFGVLALLLACVGIYGVFAFAAIQRTGEMAIRVALGARRIQVAWVTLREALLLVGIGIAIGVTTILVSGYAASGRVSKLLFGLEVTDLQTIAVATLLLALVAALAAYLPARRASRVDPIAALRHE
ncbi:MAG TPA: ABC transporter permease [Terriglobia bacterium]|nr:ABC transporter permease [Terriglobia bacterium]